MTAKKTLKTGLKAMQDIVDVLELHDVVSNVSLTGEIRTLNRRLDSDKEDIVINSTHVSAKQVGNSFFNINIHVPNLEGQTAGYPNVIDGTQPDLDRMKEISEKIVEAVEGFRGVDFALSLDSGGEVIPNGKNWYYNLRVMYLSFRKDKK